MPLTLDERKEIKKLLGTMSLTKIAQRLNRSKNSVVTEVRINGGSEEYDPKKANERAIVVHREGHEKMMLANKKIISDRETKWNYNHLRGLIQDQGREIEELKEHIQIILKNTDTEYVMKVIKRMSALERKVTNLKKQLQKENKCENLSVSPV